MAELTKDEKRENKFRESLKKIYPNDKLYLEKIAIDVSRNKASVVNNIKHKQFSELLHRRLCDLLVDRGIHKFETFEDYLKHFDLEEHNERK